MRVFQAETGRAFEVAIDPKDTVESLALKLADSTVVGLSPQQQVLLNANGTKLVNRNPISEYKNDVIFLFSKLTSTSNPPAIHLSPIDIQVPPWESLKFPPELESASTNKLLIELARRFFFHLKFAEALVSASKKRFDLCSQLISERAIQIQAIQAALNNLTDHHKKNDHALEMFTREYQRQMNNLESIAKSFDSDLERLKTMPLHPSMKTPSRNTLFDLVLENRLRQALDACKKDFAHFKGKVEELNQMSQSLDASVNKECTTLASNADVQHIERTLADASAAMEEQNAFHSVLLHDFQQIMQHVASSGSKANTDILEAFKSVHSRHETELLKNMQTTDAKLSSMILRCADEKNNVTRQLFDKMRSISVLQTEISTLGRKVTTAIHALNEMKQKLFQFVVVHNLPEGYVVCLIESFRRYRFASHYFGEIGKFSEYLARLRANEENKREKFQKVYDKYIFQGAFPEFADMLPDVKCPNPEMREPRISNLTELFEFGIERDVVVKYMAKLAGQPDENGIQSEDLFSERMPSLFEREIPAPGTAEDMSHVLREKDATIASLEELTRQLEAQKQKYDVQVVELEQQLVSLNQFKNDEIEKLKEELSSQHALQLDFEAKLAELEQDPRHHHNSNDDSLSELERRIAILEVENTELHECYNTAVSDIEKDMKEIARVQNELAQCHVKVNETDNALQKAREGETRLKEATEALKTRIAELEATNSLLERQRNEQGRAQTQISDLQRQLQQAETARTTAQASLTKMSDNTKKLENENQQLQSQLRQATESKETLSFQITQLTSRLQSLDQELRKRVAQDKAEDVLLRQTREELEAMQKKYEYAEQRRHEHAQNNAHLEKQLFQCEQSSRLLLSRFAGLLLSISHQLPNTAEAVSLLDNAISSGDFASCFPGSANSQLEALEHAVVQLVQEKIEHSVKLLAGDFVITFSNFQVTSNCVFSLDSRGNYMALHRGCPNYFISQQCVSSLEQTTKGRLAGGGPPAIGTAAPKFVLGQIIYLEKREATRDFPSSLKEGTPYWCCDIEFL